jgi:hypothetical protein
MVSDADKTGRRLPTLIAMSKFDLRDLRIKNLLPS